MIVINYITDNIIWIWNIRTLQNVGAYLQMNNIYIYILIVFMHRIALYVDMLIFTTNNFTKLTFYISVGTSFSKFS